MMLRHLFAGLLFFLSMSQFLHAEISPVYKTEVDHLLLFIKNSQCVFNRNGKNYSADKGLWHIEKKYQYYSDEIVTSEDFIRLAASKSTMSGEYYMVTCVEGLEQKAQNWLLQELKRYRESK